MSEIEKMYRNAGVNSFKTCEFCTQRSVDCIKENISNITCGFSSDIYPPFTAEKQLALIKWLGELDMLEIIRTTREDKVWIINSEYGMFMNVYKHTSRMKSFEEALAKLTNSLWQDLTEQEKQQIKEILK